MRFRLRRRARRISKLRREVNDREHIAWARNLNVPRHRRRTEVAPATAEDEELLLRTFGKTSEQLADEAERGYDLTRIKHEFVGMVSKPLGPSGLLRDAPCRVCGDPKESWPHLAREITNPEDFSGPEYEAWQADNY